MNSLKFEGLIISALSLVLGVALALALAACLGENPLLVLEVLFKGALSNTTALGYTLFYATPLIFTGLAVAWAMKAGLLNIGAEGQMTMGGIAMAAVGAFGPHVPTALAVPLALLAAFIAGGVWALLAGWMKAYRGCHEVLATLLLNFVSYGIAGFLIVGSLKNPESASPETFPIFESYRIPDFSWVLPGSPANWSLVLGLLAAGVFSVIFSHSLLGFRQRMVGEAPGVAFRAGVSLERQVLLAMFISGGLAGIAGASIILGYAFKAREGFAGGIGFMGVAVALLGRNSALGVVLSALLFGALTKGALDLDLDTQKITHDLALVIQALIVLSVCCAPGWSVLVHRLRRGTQRSPSAETRPA